MIGDFEFGDTHPLRWLRNAVVFGRDSWPFRYFDVYWLIREVLKRQECVLSTGGWLG